MKIHYNDNIMKEGVFVCVVVQAVDCWDAESLDDDGSRRRCWNLKRQLAEKTKREVG